MRLANSLQRRRARMGVAQFPGLKSLPRVCYGHWWQVFLTDRPVSEGVGQQRERDLEIREFVRQRG
jgi:hypothetical protein